MLACIFPRPTHPALKMQTLTRQERWKLQEKHSMVRNMNASNTLSLGFISWNQAHDSHGFESHGFQPIVKSVLDSMLLLASISKKLYKPPPTTTTKSYPIKWETLYGSHDDVQHRYKPMLQSQDIGLALWLWSIVHYRHPII